MRVYRSSYSLDQVIDTVSCTLGVERSEVLSRSRQRRLSLARALITWYATERGVATLAEVARRLERDPSTLFVGVERYRNLRPELFNLTALPDNGPLVRPGPPGAVPSGVTLPNAVTHANGVTHTSGVAVSSGIGASAGGGGASGLMTSSGVVASSGVGVQAGGAVSASVAMPPGVEEPPTRGVGPALLSGAWVTRR
jgi:hypothetical protein